MHPASQVLVGALLADFAAAFFHFFEDTYLPYSHDHGIMGDISRANELHHAVPFGMTSETIVANTEVTFPLSICLAALALLVFPKLATQNWILLLTMVFFGTMANVFHRWQHERACHRPRLITLLQETGILVGRDHHRQHHENPRARYGTIFACTNYVYDGVGVWDACRSLIPLRQYPKPGVSAYRHLVPEHIHTELGKPCPRKLSRTELDRVKRALAKVH